MKHLMFTLGVSVSCVGGSTAQAALKMPKQAVVMHLGSTPSVTLVKGGKVGKPKLKRTTRPTFQKPATVRGTTRKGGSKITGPGKVRIPKPWPPAPPPKPPVKPGKRKGDDKPTRPLEPRGPTFKPGGI
ncbi:MAG: hypothetical protein ABJO27_17640 [Pseudoruegeria sp.]